MRLLVQQRSGFVGVELDLDAAEVRSPRTNSPICLRQRGRAAHSGLFGDGGNPMLEGPLVRQLLVGTCIV